MENSSFLSTLQRRLLYGPTILIAGCVVVAGTIAGYLYARSATAHASGGSPIPYEQTYLTIQSFNADPSKPGFAWQIRDGECRVALQSMFTTDATRRVDAVRPRHLQYSIEFLPPNVKSGHPETIAIWKSKDGWLWTHAEGSFKSVGELDVFLDSLPARRVAQMLASRDGVLREDALRIKKANWGNLIEPLLQLCRSENRELQSFALRNLTLLVREPMPGFEDLRLRPPRYPRRAVDVERSDDIRSTALAALQTATRDACRCLMEVGDQKTVNELAKLLGNEAEGQYTDELMECIETIYGLPPTYGRQGICGNSTPEELAAFSKQENARRMAARAQLLQWHEAHQGDPSNVQLDAILDRWHDHLIGGEFNRSIYGLDSLSERYVRLLRIGPELTLAIEMRQTRLADPAENSTLEFIKACLTGQCDTMLINRLFNGDIPEQTWACNIISASARADWSIQLNHFQYTALPADDPVEFEKVMALRSAASAALLMSTGPESLPLLEAARRDGFTNPHAEWILEFYRVPQQWP